MKRNVIAESSQRAPKRSATAAGSHRKRTGHLPGMLSGEAPHPARVALQRNLGKATPKGPEMCPKRAALWRWSVIEGHKLEHAEE